MSDPGPLIPLFVPALAQVLAFAERAKKAPLSSAEVEKIRDESACIMMTLADAQKMNESRGFIDVNPENCWADWHRLRVQMTGNGYLPRIVLCIPGGDDLRTRAKPILDAEQVEHEFRMHDDKMVRSFKASSIAWPCFSDEDFARIEKHTTVLFVLSKNFVAGEAATIAQRFLKLGRRLLDAGGIAIKCDSSGISHSAARWAGLEEKARGDNFERWHALFRTYVVYPIGSKTDLYTCGMHLLGAPDLIASEQTMEQKLQSGDTAANAVAKLFRVFGNYLLAECPVGKFVSGHTFSIERDAPRYRVVWEPCDAYPEDSFFYNSFGRWRFTHA